MRLTEKQLSDILDKQKSARLAKIRVEGIDHSEAEAHIARKANLLILPLV